MVALYSLLVFAVYLKWLPAIGAGREGDIIDQVKHLLLPSLAVGLGWVGYLARMVRASMLEILGENHIRTARAFGLPERTIVLHYALRLAILPTVTLLGVGIGNMLSGVVFAEIVFARPGVGKLIFDAVITRNYPLVMGSVIMTTILFVLCTTLADLVSAFSGPAHPGESLVDESSFSELPKRSALRNMLSHLRRDHLAVIGLVLVVVIVSSAILAPWIVPYDPNKINVRYRLKPPTTDHLLGTDQLGRDVFSRVIMGSRVALQVALVSISISGIIGLVLGMLAGYGPKWLDGLLIVIFDTVRSFPTIMFALAVVTLVGPSLNTVILVVIVTSIPVYGRIVRTQTQALRHNEFIMAERSMGAGMGRVLGLHVLPNVIGPLLIIASMDIPVVVTIEAGLSFLGLGVRPPTASWGAILNDGYGFIRNTPWLVIAGGVPLILTTLGFTFLGEAMRDVFDPKLRKEDS